VRSTGPRTNAGKAATWLNSLRHGLAAASHNEPRADREIEASARAIARAEEGSELLALARQVADAEIGCGGSEAREWSWRILQGLLGASEQIRRE
jgi:hypothetical protein